MCVGTVYVGTVCAGTVCAGTVYVGTVYVGTVYVTIQCHYSMSLFNGMNRESLERQT